MPTVTAADISQNCANTAAVRVTITPAVLGTKPTAYLLQQSFDNGATWSASTFVLAADAPQTLTTISNLSPGTQIKFRVAAQNSALPGQSNWVESGLVTTGGGITATPANLAIGSNQLTINGNTVLVTWNSSITGTFELTILRAGAGNVFAPIASMPVTINSGATNSYQYRTAELNGGAYRVTISANSNNCVSPVVARDFSVASAALPGAPTNLTATRGDAKVSLSWVAPVNSGNVLISDYVVQYSVNNVNWLTFNDGVSANTATIVTGLTNGTTYYFRVAAVNAAGTGPYSNVPAATPGTVPTIPRSLTATAANAQVTLNWTAPSNNGGYPITDYVVRYSTANPFSSGFSGWTLFNDGVTTNTTTTVAGLTNGITHYFIVAAKNEIGEGSLASAQATPGLLPGQPQNVSGTLSGGLNNLSATITWQPPENNQILINNNFPVTSYNLQYRLSTATNWTTINTQNLTATVGLPATTVGSSYVFSVAAINRVGIGSYTAPISLVVVGVPSQPAAPTIGTIGNGTITITWVAPADNGSAIIRYETQAVVAGSLAIIAGPTVIMPNNLTTTFNGLTNSASYVFQVRAVNGAGAGNWSPFSAQVSPGAVPAAPTNFSATPGDARVTLAWSAPADNGGFAVTGYTVEYREAATTQWLSVGVGTSLTTIITALTNGKTYEFRVAATNTRGRGAFTNTVTARVFDPTTRPNGITNLALSADACGVVTVTIPEQLNNPGSEIIKYYVFITAANSTQTCCDQPPAVSVSRTAGNTTYEIVTRIVLSNCSSIGIYTDLPCVYFRYGDTIKVSAAAMNSAGLSLVSGNEPSITIPVRPRNSGFTVTALGLEPAATNQGFITNQKVIITKASLDWSHETTIGKNWTWSQVTNDPMMYVPSVVRVFEIFRGAENASGDPNSNPVAYVKIDTLTGLAVTSATVTTPNSEIPGRYKFFVKETVRLSNQPASACTSLSAPVTVYFPGNPSIYPGRPTNLTCAPANGSVTLTWGPAATNGGSDISFYEVYYGLQNSNFGLYAGGLFYAGRVNAGNPLTFTVNGLTNGSTYNFGVLAVNAGGLASSEARVACTPTGFYTSCNVSRPVRAVAFIGELDAAVTVNIDNRISLPTTVQISGPPGSADDELLLNSTTVIGRYTSAFNYSFVANTRSFTLRARDTVGGSVGFSVTVTIGDTRGTQLPCP